MDITKLDINDIAQNIDMGMLCFIHKETLELVHYPDPEQFYDDIEEKNGLQSFFQNHGGLHRNNKK